MKRDVIVYLEVIQRAADQILEYVEGVDKDNFLRNNMLKDACLMQLIVIGENGGHVPHEIRDRFKEIEWHLMKAARNFFAHAYDYVDWNRVWDTINEVIPDLKLKIAHIIEVLEKENNGKTN